MDYRTLKISTGPSEMLKSWLDSRMLRGQVKPVPRGTGCTRLPRFLHQYMWCNISVLMENI